MLRFTADARTIAFIAAYFAVLVAAWVMVPPGSHAAMAGLCVLLCIQSWISAVITHNSIHTPLFKQRTLNRLWQVLLTLSYGFPVSEYYPGHNISHHGFTQQPRDAMRTTKVRYRINAVNGLLFSFHVAFDVLGSNMRYASAMKTKNPRWYRQMLLEASCTWGVKLVALYVDWQKALVFLFVPHLFAVWGITAVNYLQHDGAERGSAYNHSRNFVGKIFNWFTFNNGFHTVHHDQPGLHWSLLPAVHAEKVHPHIHPALEQKSLAVYLVKTFLYPGRRVTFDGRPVELPDPPVPDEDWTGVAIAESSDSASALPESSHGRDPDQRRHHQDDRA